MLGHPRHLWPALLALATLTAGCGSESQQDLVLISDSVVAGLETWKNDQRVDTLRSRSPPIEFHDDDWQRGVRLINYELTKTYRDTDGAPRCAVTLSIQSRGKPKTIKVTYQANTSSTIVIARDPFS
jgi:hypothetical protein